MEYLNSQQLRLLGEAIEHCPDLLEVLDAGFQTLADDERDRCVSANVVGHAHEAAVYAGKTKALEEAIGNFRYLMEKSMEELARLPETVEGESGS